METVRFMMLEINKFLIRNMVTYVSVGLATHFISSSHEKKQFIPKILLICCGGIKGNLIVGEVSATELEPS